MNPVVSGRVVHLELHTPDLSQALCFYRRLCGWRDEHIETPAGPYLALELGGGFGGGIGSGIGGGIVESPTERPLWLPYMEVQDIRAMTDRAEVLGATVMLDPREGPAGWRSVVGTGAGGQIALWQPKR